MDTTKKELTLMLLYLTAWKEDEFGTKSHLRSWKGYNFDTLNLLSDENFIVDGKKSKSVLLTTEGESYAKLLLQKYEIL